MFTRISVSAACVLALLGCAQHSSPVAPAALPPVAELDSRAASASDSASLDGTDTLLRSAGAVENGTTLSLASTPGTHEWAIYRFTPPAGFMPQSLDVLLDDQATDEAWIALARFDTGVWEHFGPFSEVVSIFPQSLNDYISPGGHFYAAVLCSGDHTAAIESVMLTSTGNGPPVASFTATPPYGDPGEAVTLDASASSDPDGTIAKYEWDLDGDGSFELDNGLVPTAPTTLPDPAGSVDVTLRVTDDGGATGEHTLTLTSGAAAGWTFYPVHESANAHGTAQLIELGGTPAVCFVEATVGLQFAYTAQPDGSSGWNTALIDNTIVSTSNMTSSLAEINGTPAVAYHNDDNDDLRFAYTATADGSGGWTVKVLDAIANHGYSPSLALVAGKPAVAYSVDPPSMSTVVYGYSATSDGSDGWTLLTIDGDGNPRGPSLAVIDGKPAIAYCDDTSTTSVLDYAFSSTLDGSSGWFHVTAYSDRAPAAGTVNLALINGFPAISFRGFLSGDGNDIQYAYSTVANGSSSWSTVNIEEGNISNTTDLALFGGFPALCYKGAGSETVLATSTSADGSSGWSSAVIVPDGTKGSLAEINGDPAIAFQNSAGIQFAIYK